MFPGRQGGWKETAVDFELSLLVKGQPKLVLIPKQRRSRDFVGEVCQQRLCMPRTKYVFICLFQMGAHRDSSILLDVCRASRRGVKLFSVS